MTIRQAVLLILFSHAAFSQLRMLQTADSKYFEVKYEKSVTKEELRIAISGSEKIYKRFREKFGFGLSQKKYLFIFSTAGRFRYESGSKVFDDGDYRSYNLYAVIPGGREHRSRLEEIFSRIISRALLDEVPACPPWFAEAYSLYAGNDVERFGRPFHLNISAFADLGEDYSRSLDKRGLTDLYSKLGGTIEFLLAEYGERKIEAAIRQFREGNPIGETFPAAFGEPMNEIEKKWVRFMKDSSRE